MQLSLILCLPLVVHMRSKYRLLLVTIYCPTSLPLSWSWTPPVDESIKHKNYTSWQKKMNNVWIQMEAFKYCVCNYVFVRNKCIVFFQNKRIEDLKCWNNLWCRHWFWQGREYLKNSKISIQVNEQLNK